MLSWVLQVDGKGPKKSWKFLQKYWHKGAFFQDEGDAGRDAVGGDAIFRRDYSAPTGEDKMDKTVLPKVPCPAHPARLPASNLMQRTPHVWLPARQRAATSCTQCMP